MNWVDLVLILDSTVRLSVPVILACLAGLYSERAGIVDIGLEGKLLASAFAAAAAAAVSGSSWVGLMAGITVSVAMSMIHGLASINFKGNQVISGVALNFLASGLTVFLGSVWFKRGGETPQLTGGARFPEITLELLWTTPGPVTLAGWPSWIDWLRPAAEVLLWGWSWVGYLIGLPFALLFSAINQVPVIGYIANELILGHRLLEYVAFLAVPITAFVLFGTRFGLRLRAAGENPKAIDTAGISVTRIRYQALIITGVLVGMGGAYLSIAHGAGFTREMSAGKGFIALAALIFAKWRPWPALATCLMFGFLDAMQFRLQGASLPVIGDIPVQAIQVLPYLLTIVLLAGFIGRAVAPKASGVPYTKER